MFILATRHKLVSGSYSGTILQHGSLRRYVYQREAAKEDGKGSGPIGTFMGAGEWLRGQGHTLKSQWNAARGAVEITQVTGHKIFPLPGL